MDNYYVYNTNRSKNELTNIMINWLKDEFPHIAQAVGYYNTIQVFGYDDVTAWGHSLMGVHHDHVSAGLGRLMNDWPRLHISDPLFFAKLRPIVQANLKQIPLSEQIKFSL